MGFQSGRRASCAFSATNSACAASISVALTMASTGHSGTHTEQSMQPSGSMARKFGPSTKQSIGQTLTQSVYLHWMQLSVTTKGMVP